MSGNENAGPGTLSAPADPPRVYRLPAVGQLLGGISRRTVSNLIAQGELEAIPVAGIRMVTRESVDAYLERQREKKHELDKAVSRTAAARKALAAA